MCGRTACTLAKCCLIKSCNYKQDTKNLQLPEWKDVCDDRQYIPSYNKAPGSLSPVLVSKSHFEEDCSGDDRVICPMVWGLVPPWHKGDPKDFHFKTNNCRVETILEKPTYSRPLRKGKRCVILADGFYEWKREQKSKQPYFIFFPQKKKMEEREWVEHKEEWWNEKQGWHGPRLLTMAGLFDVFTDKSTGKKIYSYTVITVEAPSELSWMHNRMPAILDGDKAVASWLNYEQFPHEEVLDLLMPIANIQWYPVSSLVNNSRNNEVECVRPISESPVKKESKNALMNWLTPTRPNTSGSSSPPKKIKKEK